MSFENWEKFVADTISEHKKVKTPAANGNKSNTLKKRQNLKKRLKET